MPEGVVRLTDLVSYQEGSVVSRTIVKNAAGTITVFAFDGGQALSEHTAAFDALIQVLEGESEITLGGAKSHLCQGESVFLPADVPHAVNAVKPFKMLLTMLKG